MTAHIVALLVAERDRLTRAIEALQGPTKRRGRPPRAAQFDYTASNVPDWVKPRSAVVAPVKKRKRRVFTAAQRKEQAERMRAYWANRRKGAK